MHTDLDCWTDHLVPVASICGLMAHRAWPDILCRNVLVLNGSLQAQHHELRISSPPSLILSHMPSLDYTPLFHSVVSFRALTTYILQRMTHLEKSATSNRYNVKSTFVNNQLLLYPHPQCRPPAMTMCLPRPPPIHGPLRPPLLPCHL